MLCLRATAYQESHGDLNPGLWPCRRTGHSELWLAGWQPWPVHSERGRDRGGNLGWVYLQTEAQVWWEAGTSLREGEGWRRARGAGTWAGMGEEVGSDTGSG